MAEIVKLLELFTAGAIIGYTWSVIETAIQKRKK